MLPGQLQRPERAVFNLHVPPFGTQLDEAPVLDANLRVQATLGQVQMVPVGSTAVRDVEPERTSRCSGCTVTSTSRPASGGSAAHARHQPR